jgi:alpha-beta hydrolase superfamily lysophospholipase
LCHGFTGDSSGLFLPNLAEDLSQEYLVCKFDFSGQGKSEGNFHTTSITKEINDLNSVINKIKQKYFPKNIILIGYSFGATITLLYAAKNKVQGLISLSGEGDLEKAISYEFSKKQLQELENHEETFIENWSKGGIKDLLGKQFLDDMKKYSTLKAAKKIKCPTLLIHGKNDTVIPHTATEKVYNLIKSAKEVKYMKDTNHFYNFFSNNSKIQEMSSHIKKWLKNNYEK